MIDASVYMITKNEERYLAETLACLRDFAEVVVVDCGSTDKTPEIAWGFPNVRFLHHDWEGFARQKQWALDQCTRPWVVNVDADERVQPELAQAIAQTIAEDKVDGLYFVISDVFMGRPCRRWKVSGRLHCFRRGCGRYDLTNDVHEGILFSGKSTAKTHAAVLHYGIPDVATAVAKQNQYSPLRAQEKFRKGKRAKPLKLLFVRPFTFLAQYLGKGNWRDGWAGFVRSQMAANYAFMKEAKLFALWREAGQGKDA